MKKHFYFFIAATINIILCIYSIVTSNEIIKSTLETAEKLPESLKERVIELYSNNGSTYICVMASIGIALGLLMIISILRKTVTKRKFVALSVFSILFAPHDLVTLISILSLVLCITIKDDINVITKIPELKVNRDKKYITNSFILIAVYLSQFLLKYLPITTNEKYIISIALEILLLVLSITLFFDLLKEEFIAFKNNFGSYIRYILPKLGICYIIYIVVSLICTNITKQATSVNQQSLEKLNTLYVAYAAIIWAPIVEEAIFRRCLRINIKNNIVFIITSAIIFGLLHTMHEATLANVILMGLPYMILGGYLAYIYTKTNNMFSNMLSHATINAFALLIMIIGL